MRGQGIGFAGVGIDGLPRPTALTVAMTLAPLAAEPANVQRFVTAFLGSWGDALGRDKRRRQDRRGRRRRRTAGR